MRKGENAGNQHFLLFPTMFSNGFLPTVIKNQGLCGKDLSHQTQISITVYKNFQTKMRLR